MDDRTFEEWMQAVDKELEERIGLDSKNVSDVDYWMKYHSYMTPEEVVNEMLKGA